MQQPPEDGATVPTDDENRLTQLGLNGGERSRLDKEVDELTEDE